MPTDKFEEPGPAEGRVGGRTEEPAEGAAGATAGDGFAARAAGGVVCPGCGASGPAVRTVPDACADPDSPGSGLSDRLAKSPGADSAFDSVLHFLEGMVLTGVCAGLAQHGVQDDNLLFTVGGAVLAVLLFVGTFWVIRGESRERATVKAGRPRAEALWTPAHYCASCESVFYPTGSPWPGPLTTDQFRKYVWTEAGFTEQLDEKLRQLELPPRTPAAPGGPHGHA
ncbi:hypothetical protein ABT147_04130 [Streptomyces sp. NPDC001868]|uniref:hypothetical protein n=1 Tax=Streptomyces sp. NPDC001868 TaxID=3154401 RepID=UPI0033202C81